MIYLLNPSSSSVSVAVLARTLADIEAVTQYIQNQGGEAIPIQRDIAQSNAIEKAYILVVDKQASVDILVMG